MSPKGNDEGARPKGEFSGSKSVFRESSDRLPRRVQQGQTS